MATHRTEDRNGQLRTEIQLDPGETVALRRCFASGKFTFCDGSHRKQPGKVAPVIVRAPAPEASKET